MLQLDRRFLNFKITIEQDYKYINTKNLQINGYECEQC